MKDKSPEEIEEMKRELTNIGFEELTDPADVDDFLARSGTKMIVVNSVCSCAGQAIREGVAGAVETSLNVDHTGTVFAGVDDAATEEVRSRAPDTEPSSPSIYLFADGEVQRYIPRSFTVKHDYRAEDVTDELNRSVEETAAAGLA